MNAVPRIPLSRPSITAAEVALVTDAIQNGWEIGRASCRERVSSPV